MDLSKNNQYDSRSETVEMGRKLHTAAPKIEDSMKEMRRLSVFVVVQMSVCVVQCSR